VCPPPGNGPHSITIHLHLNSKAMEVKTKLFKWNRNVDMITGFYSNVKQDQENERKRLAKTIYVPNVTLLAPSKGYHNKAD
jgi:hypothetical protein